MATLFIVATPIGAIDDITIRAIKTLFTVSYIACEDTRVTGQLLSLLENRYSDLIPKEGRKPVLVSYRNTNELTVTAELISYLQNGRDVALVSDAGTPGISDPGYPLIQAVQKRNIPYVVLPGASSVLHAIIASGLPTNQWTFLGFLPEKESHRQKLLTSLLTVPFSCTYIFFVAPHKALKTLLDLQAIFGRDLSLVIARELTKKHEEIWHGTIEDAISKIEELKGEQVYLFHLTSTNS